MRTAGIAELKASLSETLARVKAGEEILVTEHGRPIAKIVPLSPSIPEASTDELVRAGVLRRPDQPLDKSFWTMPRPDDPEAAALNALIQERRGGR